MATPRIEQSLTKALIKRSIVWDNHVCLPHRREAEWFAALEKHRAAGASFISVNLGDAQVPLDTQIRMAAHFRAQIAASPHAFVLATTVADIRRAKKDGKLAVAFDVEGAWAMDGQPELAAIYGLIGVRWISIAFNKANAMGGGVHDEEDQGLTPTGRLLLDALSDAGIMLCCSHTGYRTTRDAIAYQAEHGRPLIVSHSNAKALDDHPRNVPDDIIASVAATGGVVGINGLSIFLGNSENLIERYLDHVDYVAGLAGHEHVGIGLDYVYDQADMDAQLLAARGTWPAGYGYEPGIRYVDPDALPRIAEGLLLRNWSDDQVTGFLGGNFLRVAERVWK